MNKWASILASKPINYCGKASEWGVAAATLCALVKRGYLTKTNSAPAFYTKLPAADKYVMVCNYIAANPNEDYYDLWRENESLAMMCGFDGKDILDCYGEKWDIANCVGYLVWENGVARKMRFDNRNFDKNQKI